MNPYRDNQAPNVVRIDAGEFTVITARKSHSADAKGNVYDQVEEIGMTQGSGWITVCNNKAVWDELSKVQGRRVRVIIEAYDE